MTWLLLGRRSAPLWLRLGLPISLIIALAIGLISFLNYYNYRKTYQQLNVARIMVVARDLRQAIESGLNVGLVPRSNTQLATSLTITKDHTDGVRFAVVIDQAAKRLVEVGEAAASQDWLRRMQRVGEIVSWLGEDDDTYQVGLPFRNSFGTQRSGFRDPGIISHRKLFVRTFDRLLHRSGKSNCRSRSYLPVVNRRRMCGDNSPCVNSFAGQQFCFWASFREADAI